MFVRTKTTPNSPRKSIQIVQNHRDPKTGKVKQKIVRYVGVAMDQSEEEKLKALALEIIAKILTDQQQTSHQLSMLPALSEAEMVAAISAPVKSGRKTIKRIEDILPVSQVSLDMIVEESRIIDGVHEVGGHLYELMGYGKLLRNNKYNEILKDLVLCRISNPASKLATNNMLRRYYMKEHKMDTIYRVMDQVYDNIDAIQSSTFASTRSLMGSEVEIILFDVTTLHFESTEVDDLRKFGYSKNFRFNTTQVVLALATNTDGLPIGYELFEGNKAEVTTLIETIDGWKKKFIIGNVCFIGDRAMFSANNLKQLEERGYHYIVAAKLRTLPKLLQQKIMTEDNYSWSAIDDELALTGEFTYDQNDVLLLQEEKAKSNIIKKYQESIEENKSRRFIVSYSSKRAHHDVKHRETLLKKISKQLAATSNAAKLISNSALKKYTSSAGKAVSYIDEDKIVADSLWDGFHGVITNIKESEASKSHILAQYRRLVKIEDCFRVNKTTLKMRPIYHFKPERIRAHVAICYMAFAVVRQLEYRVKLQKKLSIGAIIEELNSVQSSIYVHKVTKDRYRVPGNFSNEARKIYSAGIRCHERSRIKKVKK
jgi:transposase